MLRKAALPLKRNALLHFTRNGNVTSFVSKKLSEELIGVGQTFLGCASLLRGLANNTEVALFVRPGMIDLSVDCT